MCKRLGVMNADTARLVGINDICMEHSRGWNANIKSSCWLMLMCVVKFERYRQFKCHMRQCQWQGLKFYILQILQRIQRTDNKCFLSVNRKKRNAVIKITVKIAHNCGLNLMPLCFAHNVGHISFCAFQHWNYLKVCVN